MLLINISFVIYSVNSQTGRLGPIALQFAPDVESEEEYNYDVEKNMKRGVVDYSTLVGASSGRYVGEDPEAKKIREQNEREQRAEAALNLAKEKGLELPPIISDKEEGQSIEEDNNEVGKGMFDGW